MRVDITLENIEIMKNKYFNLALNMALKVKVLIALGVFIWLFPLFVLFYMPDSIDVTSIIGFLYWLVATVGLLILLPLWDRHYFNLTLNIALKVVIVLGSLLWLWSVVQDIMIFSRLSTKYSLELSDITERIAIATVFLLSFLLPWGGYYFLKDKQSITCTIAKLVLLLVMIAVIPLVYVLIGVTAFYAR